LAEVVFERGDFDIAASNFGFVSDFAFRASDLDRKIFGCGCGVLMQGAL
jgi:hypothetical protein